MNTQERNKHRRNSHSSSETDSGPQFGDALLKFEKCLEAPVVPGELPSWTSAVGHAFKNFAEPLHREIEEIHKDHFAEISEEAPDLLRRVEQMREEDSKLLVLYEELSNKLRKLREGAERVEPHESKLEKARDVLVDEGLQFVIRARKQQQAISTWLLEAFYRDRGVAD
ncbi:MAG: hypothetical protein R3E01_01845 [Pirellulaceae bacterium]